MNNKQRSLGEQSLSKVPQVVLGFWIIKIAATTLGETGGDWVSMSLKLGYLVGSAIFAAIFMALVWGQVKADRFRPILCWATIVATTTQGRPWPTSEDRSVGLGYPGGVTIVAAFLAASIAIWYWSEGTGFGAKHRPAEGRGVLLGDDPFLANPRSAPPWAICSTSRCPPVAFT